MQSIAGFEDFFVGQSCPCEVNHAIKSCAPIEHPFAHNTHHVCGASEPPRCLHLDKRLTQNIVYAYALSNWADGESCVYMPILSIRVTDETLRLIDARAMSAGEGRGAHLWRMYQVGIAAQGDGLNAHTGHHNFDKIRTQIDTLTELMADLLQSAALQLEPQERTLKALAAIYTLAQASAPASAQERATQIIGVGDIA